MCRGGIDFSLGGVGLAPDGSWYGMTEVMLSLSLVAACPETAIDDLNAETEKCKEGDDGSICTVTCKEENQKVIYECKDKIWTSRDRCPTPSSTMDDRVGTGMDVVVLVSRLLVMSSGGAGVLSRGDQ